MCVYSVVAKSVGRYYFVVYVECNVCEHPFVMLHL